VSIYELIQKLIDNTTGPSLAAFGPELAISATIVALLLVRMLDGSRLVHPFFVMVLGTAAAVYLTAPWRYLATTEGQAAFGQIFTGMLVLDGFSVYMRALLLFFALIFAAFTQIAGVPDREDATDFYVMILGATLGMCLMVSANHMLMVFLAVEMASVPSYALAGILRQRRQSSEAALKFAVFGAATAGVMLYGISLLCGLLGTAHLPTMTGQLHQLLAAGLTSGEATVLVLGALMVMVGLAFKLSAVPFHFWAPDVFEGTTAEVAAFLSIASKAAALALLARLAIGFGSVEPPKVMPQPPTVAQVAAGEAPMSQPAKAGEKVAGDPRKFLVGLIAVLAAITCTFGNLAAYGQTNIKRMLAYSTIAHAGYMMMAVAAAVALAASDHEQANTALASLAFYLGIYLFMNLGAFAAAAFLRNSLGSEQILEYAGLVRRSPGFVVCFAIVLFSLVGLPPLAGFSAKFTIFSSLANYDPRLLGLLVVGGVNTVLSLFYYLRVVRVMTLEPEPAARPAPSISLASIPGQFSLVVALPLVVLGIWWDPLFTWAKAAAQSLIP
jgi:NADH-quinone oxidoreductase subunit N